MRPCRESELKELAFADSAADLCMRIYEYLYEYLDDLIYMQRQIRNGGAPGDVQQVPDPSGPVVDCFFVFTPALPEPRLGCS
jgi:hypothetical protein